MQNPPQPMSLMRTLLILLLGLFVPLLWPGVFTHLFSTEHFQTEHHHDWPLALTTLHVGSDVLIGISYAVIAAIIAYIVYRNRQHLPFDHVILAFGLFIIACGITHVMHVVTRFQPIYWFDAYLRALTAIVSVATAVLLPPLVPRVAQLLQSDQQLKLKQKELEEANRRLEQALEERQFHASLSDLLQSVSDPREVAEQALSSLGPMLHVEQILAMHVRDQKVQLWSVWGKLREDTRKRMDGTSTPLSKLPIIQKVVHSGQAMYLDDYGTHPQAIAVEGDPIAVAIEPVKNHQGEVVATLNFARPATLPWQNWEREVIGRAAATVGLALTRTELNRELQARETQLHEAMQNAPLGEVLQDLSGRVLRANPAASRILGYTAEELSTRNMDSLTHPDDRERTRLALARLTTGKQDAVDMEKRYLHKDGHWIWTHLHASLVRNEQGEPGHYIKQFLDITEQHELAEQLRHSENKYRTIARNFPNGAIVLFDHDLRYQLIDGLELAQLGLTPEMIEGRMLSELWEPEVAGPLEVGFRQALAGQPNTVEVTYQGRIYECRQIPLFDGEGRVTAGLHMTQNVTEERQQKQQLEQLTARLERSNQELQDFAYVASHDLQEPVRKIIAFGSRLALKEKAHLSETGQDHLGRMVSAAERMQTLIQDLLKLSRVNSQGKPFAPVCLGEVLEKVTEDLCEQLTRTAGTVEVGPLPQVMGDATQLRQLMQNLVGNALKYHQPGLPPQVQITASEVEAGVQIQVSDNGIGFEPHEAEKIFLPFQRLHGRGTYEGTGIGLAICRRIVERHGGTLTARSEPDRGSTFILTLPKEVPHA